MHSTTWKAKYMIIKTNMGIKVLNQSEKLETEVQRYLKGDENNCELYRIKLISVSRFICFFPYPHQFVSLPLD